MQDSTASAVAEAVTAYISESGLDAKEIVLIPANKPAVSLCADVEGDLGIKEVYTGHFSDYLSAFGLSGLILNQFFRTDAADINGLADPDIIMGDD